VEGFKGGPDVDNGSSFNEIAPDYFKTMQIPVLAGREFARSDTLGGPKVAIVNETFAKKFNLGTNAVGKRISTAGNDSKLDVEIIGLVKDSKYSEVKDTIPPLLFQPYRQDERIGSLSFYVRTSGAPEQIVQTIRRVVATVDSNLPVENLRTMRQQVRDNVFLDRMISTMSATFAVLATLLAAIGLYGVLAYTVTLRTREFGLRMALGADPGRVRALVLRQVLWMTGVGLVIGIGAAAALGPYAESLLYRVAGFDPIVMIVAAIALVAVALVAGFAPAHRAARLDPMRALRYE